MALTETTKIDQIEVLENGTIQIRIATIGTDGRRSPYAYSKAAFSSPLAFNFDVDQSKDPANEPLTVKLINGTDVANQRYLFLVL